jgi:hypothetical protein
MTMLQAVKNLPREARDTLFLLAVIAWVIGPKIGTLPLWCSALAAGLLAWRGYLAVRNRALPSRWWLMGLLLAATGATFYSHRTLLGQEATFLSHKACRSPWPCCWACWGC